MRAAIYARRSTEEHQASSLETQLGEARRFIASKGWTLDDAHVFVDSGVSRAEFKKRPALIRMLALASARARPFDVVVTRDETRLGGDTFLTGQLVADLLQSGTKLRYYFTDEDVRLETAVDKFMLSARNFASELEREKVSQRTRENHLVKAREGRVTGGRVYGYDNVPAPDGKGKVHRINPEQAAIVLQVFSRYAEGEGYGAIAKSLNLAGIPSPRARGWSKHMLRDFIRNERYRGVILWGERRKGYRAGTKVRDLTPEADRLRVEAPHLRIVDEQLWAIAQEQVRTNAEAWKRKAQPAKRSGGRPALNALSSIMRCGVCGAPMVVTNGKRSYENVKVYVCQGHKNGYGGTGSWDPKTKTFIPRKSCSNSVARPVDVVNRMVLGWVSRNVLREELVSDALAEVRKRMTKQAKENIASAPQRKAEAAKLRRQIDNLVEALADAEPGARAEIQRGIATKRERLSALTAQLDHMTAAGEAIEFELRRQAQESKKRLAALRALLANGEAPAEKVRAAVSAIFPRGLEAHPKKTADGARLLISGEATTGGLSLLEHDDSVPLRDSVPSGTLVERGTRILALREVRGAAATVATMRELVA